MTYCGHVKNGQITLDKPATLPEGARVRVEVIKNSNGKSAPDRTRRQILQLPLDQRRKLLLDQSERLAGLYADDSQRTDWQGGDILE